MLYLPSLKKKACTNPAAIHFIMLTDVRQVTLGVRASSDYSTINRNNVKRAYVYIYIFRCKQRPQISGTLEQIYIFLNINLCTLSHY